MVKLARLRDRVAHCRGYATPAWTQIGSGVKQIVAAATRVGLVHLDGRCTVFADDGPGFDWTKPVTVHDNTAHLSLMHGMTHRIIGIVDGRGNAFTKTGDLTQPWVPVATTGTPQRRIFVTEN